MMTVTAYETSFIPLSTSGGSIAEDVKTELNKKAKEGWKVISITGPIRKTAGGHEGVLIAFGK